MDSTSDRAGGRHQISIGHLVMGIAFLGIVGVWALVQTDGRWGITCEDCGHHLEPDDYAQHVAAVYHAQNTA